MRESKITCDGCGKEWRDGDEFLALRVSHREYVLRQLDVCRPCMLKVSRTLGIMATPKENYDALQQMLDDPRHCGEG